MESRKERPAYLAFELVTEENFLQKLPEVASALHLPLSFLEKILNGTNLHEFSNDLEESYRDSIAIASKSISNAIFSICEDEEVQLYLDHKNQHLNKLFTDFDQYLKTRKNELIANESAAINAFIAKLKNPRDFYAGNYALKLTILKSNIALALQRAAYYLPIYWPNVRNAPDLFNAIFLNIAHMNEQGNVAMDESATNTFANLDLATLQDRLSSIFATAQQHTNPMVSRVINDHLSEFGNNRSAKLKSGEALFAINFDKQYQHTFTPKAFEIEKLANEAAQSARQQLSSLDKNQDNMLSDFENDLGKLNFNQRIRDAITDSNNGVIIFRNIVTKVKSLTSALQQDILEVDAQIEQLEEIISREPNAHRSEISASLTQLGFDPAVQQHMLQELLNQLKNIQRTFLEANNLQFQHDHYAMLNDQFRILQTELSQLLQAAAVQMPPLDNHRKHLDDIEKRRKSLHESLNDLYKLVSKTEEQHKLLKVSYKQARDEFSSHAAALPDSAKHVPAERQIANIRRPQRSFWTQNPAAKRTQLGLLVGLVAAVICTVAVALTMFFLGGFADLGAAAAAGILVGTAIATGAGGNALGERMHDKIMNRFYHQRDHYPQQPAPLSSTANNIKKLGEPDDFSFDLEPSADELSFDSSDEDRVEVVRDYSSPRTFGDDSAEFEPRRLGPT